jgi:hypothetical protein
MVQYRRSRVRVEHSSLRLSSVIDGARISSSMSTHCAVFLRGVPTELPFTTDAMAVLPDH